MNTSHLFRDRPEAVELEKKKKCNPSQQFTNKSSSCKRSTAGLHIPPPPLLTPYSIYTCAKIILYNKPKGEISQYHRPRVRLANVSQETDLASKAGGKRSGRKRLDPSPSALRAARLWVTFTSWVTFALLVTFTFMGDPLRVQTLRLVNRKEKTQNTTFLSGVDALQTGSNTDSRF